MQVKFRRSGLSRFVAGCVAAVAVADIGAHVARAEPAATDRPPVAIGGWRYEKGTNDVYLFHCEAAACVAGSKVSYRFYAPGTTVTFAQYRSEQELVIKALQQRAPPGTTIKIVAIEGDQTDTGPRMYKSRRLTVSADGSQEHVHSGILLGEKASVSLISSSRDEKAAAGGFSLYALALMLVAQGAPGPKQ